MSLLIFSFGQKLIKLIKERDDRMSKYEWRKADKEIYLPKDQPTILKEISYNYISISGIGNPNHPDFSKRIQVLYSLSYAIRMSYKGDWKIPGFYMYTVFPLEGVWTSHSQDLEAIKAHGLNKDQLAYKIMLRQPDFVDRAVFEKALDIVKSKDKLLTYIDDAVFETINEPRSVQILHNGSYDSEMESFEILDKYIEDNNLERVDPAYHKEIYLRMDKKDSNRNQTTLRFYIKDK